MNKQVKKVLKIVKKVLDKLGFFKRFNFNVKVKINGKTFKVPIIRGIGLNNIRITETWMVQLFKQIFNFQNDGAFYDIGVNLGQTLIKLKSINPEIEYFGFEPNPICVFYTKELIKTNAFKKTILFPVGISNRDAIYSLSLFFDDEADSSASILDNFRPSQTTFKKEFVACFNSQSILEKYKLPKINILKIDVEGAEKDVLESFENRIKQDKPFIIIEILPVYSEENIERLKRQNEIEALLGNIDYSIFRVHKTKNGDFNGLEEIQTIGIHSNLEWCDYLLVPNSEKIKFKNITYCEK